MKRVLEWGEVRKTISTISYHHSMVDKKPKLAAGLTCSHFTLKAHNAVVVVLVCLLHYYFRLLKIL